MFLPTLGGHFPHGIPVPPGPGHLVRPGEPVIGAEDSGDLHGISDGGRVTAGEASATGAGLRHGAGVDIGTIITSIIFMTTITLIAITHLQATTWQVRVPDGLLRLVPVVS